ncbi:MAG TPA: MarR family winged helix-turn-helix transcriptional regulator [Terrimesophilobacter sp.]|nr:MarR family winged helix-turn-helix transcriptional regulator [Terrimesophilobacter sp.]HRQ00212.1 MarR family winged helix-turn-helix transcriptional regulator [Terrimesophilobacter sp.]
MVESSDDRPRGLPGKIVAAFDRIDRGIRSHRQRIATEEGLSALQADLLRVLGEGPPPPATPGALATELGVRQPTVSDSLRFLERKGLIRRYPTPEDRRQTATTLTDTGRAVLHRLTEADRMLRDSVAGLAEGRQEQTFEVLLGVIERMLDSGIITVARTCTTCRFFQPGVPEARCNLLQIALPTQELRVNCPEYSPVSA